jgi:hypothetical protein
MYVAETDGHDDYLMSIALCGKVIRDWVAPRILDAQIVRPRRLYEGESQY